MSLSDEATRRLVHYYKRAIVSRPDHLFRANVMPLSGGTSVAYLDRALRAIIWSDAEVRTACLEQSFDDLAAVVSQHGPWALALLDVVTAMSLEAEFRAEAAPEAA